MVDFASYYYHKVLDYPIVGDNNEKVTLWVACVADGLDVAGGKNKGEKGAGPGFSVIFLTL